MGPMAYDFTAPEFNDETFDHEFGHSSPFNLGPNSYHLTTEMYPFLPLEAPWGLQQTFETGIPPGIETSLLGRGSAETGLADYISSLPPRGPGYLQTQNQESPSAPRQFRCLEPGCSKLGWARPEHLRRHISMYGALPLFT
ncbi:hypothetical protein NPX13_g10532 [Xylaria arbuscula]|uniref:Uncharacterized protein n=1 Tax=Xylaria arbuscula TaxID=114810 RepID=A0A9W8THX1_9PEZI|nr:hypothetical protein NPX13_g10532 [Xylaria arbuscula]